MNEQVEAALKWADAQKPGTMFRTLGEELRRQRETAAAKDARIAELETGWQCGGPDEQKQKLEAKLAAQAALLASAREALKRIEREVVCSMDDPEDHGYGCSHHIAKEVLSQLSAQDPKASEVARFKEAVVDMAVTQVRVLMAEPTAPGDNDLYQKTTQDLIDAVKALAKAQEKP